MNTPNPFHYTPDNATSFDIARDATLVRIRTKGYSWNKKDKVAAANAAKADNADDDAFSAYARLCPDDFKELRLAPSRLVAEARELLDYPFSIKWDKDGNALVLNTKLDGTLQKLNDIRARFFDAVRDLVAELPNIEAAARAKLNGAVDRLGFPLATEVREKFDFEIVQSAVPHSDDIRLRHASPAAIAAVTASVQKQAAEKVQEIHSEVVGGITKALATLAEKLSAFNEGKIVRFEDGVFAELEAIVENLPALNVTGDRAVNAALVQSRDLLGKVRAAAEAKTLRDKDKPGKEVRKEIAEGATDILSKLKAGVVKAKV
jgi:hypothetical protein